MKLPLLTRLVGAIFPPQDLWRAASIGDVSAIRRLTAAGSDINAKRRNLSVEGDAPLHFAARHSQSEAVRALVELCAKVDARTDHGTTPLIAAAANKASVETVEAPLDILTARVAAYRNCQTQLRDISESANHECKNAANVAEAGLSAIVHASGPTDSRRLPNRVDLAGRS